MITNPENLKMYASSQFLNNFAEANRSMPFTKPHTDPAQFEESDVLTDEDLGHQLIVWNDDVNTFDWVIAALIEVCRHNQEQAEQCALLIHTQGKYAVKHGSFEVLKPMCEAISDRSINATIEDLN